mgnify:CR=1 FL=1
MKNKPIDTRKIKKIIEDIENMGYTFKGEEFELLDRISPWR